MEFNNFESSVVVALEKCLLNYFVDMTAFSPLGESRREHTSTGTH